MSAIAIRISLLFALVVAFGLSARPKRVTLEWQQVNQAEESGQVGTAAVSLMRIQAAQPWRSDLSYLTAQYALNAGNWSLGLESLGRINPNRLTAADWTAMGDAYWELDQPEQAVQAWERSRAVTENADAISRLYTFHRKQQDLSSILADLQALHRLQPGDAALAYQLAVQLTVSSPQEALIFINKTRIEDEIIQSKLKNLSASLQAAVQRLSAAEQLLVAGQGLAELGEWELAGRAFQQSLELEPAYAEALAYLGEARQHLEPADMEAALADLRQALRLNPKSIAANSMLALYWQRRGDFSRAANLYRSAAALEPENPAWFAALGGLASVQGNLPSAEGYYHYAASLAEQEAVYWRMLAVFYLTNQIRIADQAFIAANQAVKLDPDDPANLDVLAQVYLQQDKPEEARRLLDEALQKDPRFAPAYLHLSMIFLLQGRAELAYFYLQQARLYALDQPTVNQVDRLMLYYFP